jgi:SAM-dependent methyltransferase
MQKKYIGLDNEDKLSMGATINIALRKAVTERRTAQAWDELADRWSSHYTVRGDKNRQYVVDPAIFRIIGSVEGSSILDAGCGNGYLCRLLAKRGAKPVGVDISERFIEIAKQKEAKKPLGIAYHVGSLSNLFMLQDEAFDLVISNLVLMDVRHLAKAIKELHRILKKEGKLIFSIMHPCFSSPPVYGWVRKPIDSQRKEDWLYWKVDRYFDRIMEIWQFNDDWPKAYSFHRPLSDYVKLLIENGFAITDFEEPTPTRKIMREHYRQFGNECDRIPWFLVIGARKAIGQRLK